MNPIISIITPYTSDTEGLKASIKSLQRQINSFADHIQYEHIIVGQTDTEMPDFGYAGDSIRVIEMDFWSYSGAVIAGIKVAKGKYISILCAGSTYYHKEAVSNAVITLEKSNIEEEAKQSKSEKESIKKEIPKQKSSAFSKWLNALFFKKADIKEKAIPENKTKHENKNVAICCETWLKQSDGMVFLRSPLIPKSLSSALEWFIPNNIYLESIIFHKDILEDISDTDNISRSMTSRILLAHCLMKNANIISNNNPLTIKPDKRSKDDLPTVILPLEDEVRYEEIHNLLEKLPEPEKRKVWNTYYSYTSNSPSLNDGFMEKHIIKPRTPEAVASFLSHPQNKTDLPEHTRTKVTPPPLDHDYIKNHDEILSGFGVNDESLLKREVRAALAETQYKNGQFFGPLQETKKLLKTDVANSSVNNKDSETKRIVIFYESNPFPVQSNADSRIFAYITMLKKLGIKILLFSFDDDHNCCPSSRWTMSSINHLRRRTGISVEIFKNKNNDNIDKRPLISTKNGLYDNTNLKSAFSVACKDFNADSVLIFGTKWASLIDDEAFEGIKKSVDIDGFTSTRFHKQSILANILEGQNTPIDIKDSKIKTIANTKLFNKVNNRIDNWEIDTCNTFDYVITHSNGEKRYLKDKVAKEKIKKIPLAAPANYLNNFYDSAPLFIMDDDTFNLQGYVFFMTEVLPLIISQKPDFTLRITGQGAETIQDTSHVKKTTYVKDYKHEYSSASFIISPIIGSVGQQMKIVEAMANGVAGVTLSNTIDVFPIKHGKNGFIAKNASEFAEFVLKLYMDNSLCRRTGSNARNTVSDFFNSDKTSKDFSFIFQ